MPVQHLSISPVDLTQPSNGLPSVPPLENGDHLTRAEFERRYTAMPDLKKAELIEGVVFMPSPVSRQKHSRPHIMLTYWLGEYEGGLAGVEADIDASIRLGDSNMMQPDLFLRISSEYGGQAKISEDDYVENAPELVIEVASSTAAIDSNAKFRMYQRAGVKEYIVFRVRDAEVDWFVFDKNESRKLTTADGILRSETFPGLWLNVHALIDLDRSGILAILKGGMQTPEFQAFKKSLGDLSSK